MSFWAPNTIATLQGAVADTLHSGKAAAESGAEGSAIFSELLHHVQDSHELELPWGRVELPAFPPIHVGGISIDLSITKHVVFLWVAALVVVLLTVAAARKNRLSKIPTGLGGIVEVFVTFIRDEVALPNMGTMGLKYLPYLLTTFFFILTMNLAGIIPYGSTATGNISVTAGLAVIAFVMIQFSAMRAQGFGHYLAHFTGGVHWALWPIMIPIEVLGIFTKVFALCMRLFANMKGGHIVILSFIGLIFLFRSYYIAPASVGFALFVYLLELFVASLQAYVFTMLTALFMGLGIQAGHQKHAEQSH